MSVQMPILVTLTSDDTIQDRKYFDSGDYALSKAGKAPQNTVGTAIPSPEKSVTRCAHVGPAAHRFLPLQYSSCYIAARQPHTVLIPYEHRHKPD